MAEWYCKLCGYRGGAGETSCPDCGAPLFETLADLPPSSETAAEESREVDIKKKRFSWLPRGRAGLVAGFLALCVVVQGFGLWQAHRPVDLGWSYVDGNRLITPQGVWTLGDNAWMGSYGGDETPYRILTTWRNNPDGSSTEMEVWFYDGRSVEKQDWTNAQISGDGRVLFYQTSEEGAEETILRRDLTTGRETEVARGQGLIFAGASDYAGTALAYYTNDSTHGDQAIDLPCYLWQMGSGSRELAEPPSYLGKHGDNYLGFRLAQGPNEEAHYGYTQVVAWNGGERYTPVDFQVMMDRELTAVLYRGDDGDWHYENQEGRSQALKGLPTFASLLGLQPGGGAYYVYLPPRLTDQVYQAGGELFYLDEDLNVTMLTPEGVADWTCLTADGQELYFIFRPMGQKSQLWHMERGDHGGWAQPEMLKDAVESYVLSADGQTLCARCWEDKSLAWKLWDGEREWQALDNIHPRALEEDLMPMDGGGCWYRGDGSSMHRELWYRGPSGKTTLKMTYTSPFSSTMYPTDNQAEVVLSAFGEDGSMREVDDVELLDLGRGDVALLRVGYAGLGETKSKKLISSGAFGPDRGEADYWMLEADGTMTKLEAMEL